MSVFVGNTRPIVSLRGGAPGDASYSVNRAVYGSVDYHLLPCIPQNLRRERPRDLVIFLSTGHIVCSFGEHAGASGIFHDRRLVELQILHQLLILILGKPKEIAASAGCVFGLLGLIEVNGRLDIVYHVLFFAEFIEVFQGWIMLHLKSLMLSLLLSLAILALPLLVQRTSYEGLIHLLVRIELVDVVHGWPLRADYAAGCTQIIQMAFHDV